MENKHWQDTLLEDHFTEEEAPPPLPQVFSDVKRVKGGFKVFVKGKWTFYATSCLDEAQVDELEEWLIELQPGRRV